MDFHTVAKHAPAGRAQICAGVLRRVWVFVGIRHGLFIGNLIGLRLLDGHRWRLSDTWNWICAGNRHDWGNTHMVLS